MNSKLRSLGAEEICQIGEGDELSGQEDSFLEWLDECYEVSRWTNHNKTVEFVEFTRLSLCSYRVLQCKRYDS